MLPSKEKKTLEKLLRLAPEPEGAFTYDELCGFLFGLAMTPELISPAEWLPVIFGGELPEFRNDKQFVEMTDCLTSVYNRMVTGFHENNLHFPYDLGTLDDDLLEKVYGWVSGFEEALALREELWDPEEYPNLSGKKKEDLMHSIMTIQGLIDPTDIMEMFQNMPEDVFRETFPEASGEFADREMQVQVFLLATLPLAVETFQAHARTIEKQLSKKASGKTIPFPMHSAKPNQDSPCSCPGGGSCGSPPPKKKAKIIKVDFPKHGSKRPAPTAPVFQLKISLQGLKPPVWRRVQVPGNTTLARLHKVIQLCMGWTDSHMHEFLIDGNRYCMPDPDDFSDDDAGENEAKFTLESLQDKILAGFLYVYDFGDDWLHTITVEKVLAPDAGKDYPLLLAGKRACPPEDVGGVPGFLHLLEVLDNPEDEEYADLIDWLDEEYDPARFGKEEIALINVVLEEVYG
ncbi:MAG: UPF0149 family protein [Desulforhopalus sp.]|nr:UPF0149 family protein [Desulforhopalus sp.]